jgi:hypothetical protein
MAQPPSAGSAPIQRSQRLDSQPPVVSGALDDCLGRPLAPGDVRERGNVDYVAELDTLDLGRQLRGQRPADSRLAGTAGARHEQQRHVTNGSA